VGICCADSGNIDLNPLDMMFVGVPQIISDSGGYREYINESNSIPVRITSESYLANNGENSTLYEIKSINYIDVFLALERYLKDPNLLGQHSEAARQLKSDWEDNCSPLLECIRAKN
jgi:hypothetical protein